MPEALVGAIAAIVLLAACGGSSTLPHQELSAKMTVACRQATLAAERLPAPAKTYPAVQSYARRLSPIVQRLIHRLEGLRPSSADRPAFERYIGALRGGEAGINLMQGATTVAQLSQATTMAAQPMRELAGAIGVPACGAPTT